MPSLLTYVILRGEWRSGFGVLGVEVLFFFVFLGCFYRRSCISVPDLVVVPPPAPSSQVPPCSLGNLSFFIIGSSSYNSIFFWALTFSFSPPLFPIVYEFLRLSSPHCRGSGNWRFWPFPLSYSHHCVWGLFRFSRGGVVDAILSAI